MLKKVALYAVIGCLLCGMGVDGVTSVYAQQADEQMASYYYQNKQFDQAAELYEALYNKSQSKFYYQMYYQTLVELGRHKEAAQLVEKRIKKYGKELELYVDLGNLYLRQGERRKAEKAFGQAIDKVTYDGNQATNLAMAFENSGHNDYAIKTYLASREKTRNPIAYVMELASLYQKSGDYDKMTNEYFLLLDQSPGMIHSIQISLQRALFETSDARLADGLRQTLISRIRQSPNNQSYLDMMIWYSLQQKDFQFALTQAIAVDSRFPEQGGAQVMRVAQIAQNNEDYDVAEDAYNYLIAKGKDNNLYFDSRVGLLTVRYDRINQNHAIAARDLKALEEAYDAALTELGKNLKTTRLMRNYATLLAYHDNRVQEAADLLYDIIEIPRLPAAELATTKLELGDLLLFSGEIWDASLLYSQVEKAYKNDVIGAQAKFKNAQLSYYNNDFEWAKSQLDVLRASTSKLIANDAMQLSLLISDNMEDDSTYDMLSLFAAADLLLYRGQLDSAWAAYDAVTTHSLSHALFDEVLMQKAKICMKQGRYNVADSLLQRIVDHYADDILADDALFMLAELNEQQLNNAERARECYEKLILDYPASLYVDRARKKIMNQPVRSH